MIPYSIAKYLITMAVIGSEENDDNKAIVFVVKDMKNVNDWLIYSIATRQLRLDANYEDRDSLILIFEILMSLILYEVENMLKIMRYRMYLKYTIDGQKKIYQVQKIK